VAKLGNANASAGISGLGYVDPNYSGINPGSVNFLSPDDPYRSSYDGGSVIDFLSPPGGGNGGGGGYATPPHVINWQAGGANPNRRRYRRLRDANSQGYWGMPWWRGGGSYAQPWWGQQPIMSPWSGFGPSAVEMEQPGSTAWMASQLDAGAY